MKTQILIVAAAAASAMGLHGESFNVRLTADVPFAFHKIDQAMPAGRYEVKPAVTGAIVVTNHATKQAGVAIVTQRRLSLAKQGSLGFACYGSACFLREVRQPGSAVAMIVPAGRLEKEYRKGSTEARAMTAPATVSGE